MQDSKPRWRATPSSSGTRIPYPWTVFTSAPNLPRSVLRKRAWSFLVWSSRNKAAYNVLAGVCPAGLVQEPLADMAAISSVQRIGWPVSASTLAAASRALRRLLAASVGGAAGVFRALEALAVLRDVGGFFFWVAMMLLLGDRIRKEASRLPRCLLRTGQLPRRPARDQAQPERN